MQREVQFGSSLLRRIFMNRFPLRGIIALCISVAATIVSVATVAGFAGERGWYLDLFSHFRLQYLLSLIAASIVLMMYKYRRVAVLCALFAAVNLFSMTWYLIPSLQPIKPPYDQIRVASLNVLTSNLQTDSVLRFIAENDPDVVFLMEVDDRWAAAIDSLSLEYPHHRVIPRSDNFGAALYSKLPFESCETHEFGSATLPSIVARLVLDGSTITVVGTHPLPPTAPVNSSLRDQQLAEVATYLAEAAEPKVLIGDLNATPWSVPFRNLIAKSRLIDSGLGRGVRGTWPVGSLLLRIPIDHCLLSPDIAVLRRVIGRDIGSDHFPLVVDLALPRK